MKRFFKWFGLILLAILGIGLFLGYAPDTDANAMKAKYGSAASRFAELQTGLEVHYRDEGKRDGQAIVLIHGSNSSLNTWEPWVRRLEGDYRVISLDLPGHGLTGSSPSGKYDIGSYVDVVDALLSRLGIGHAVIIGNSMGGMVSWRYALAHPAKIDGLVLIDASGAPDAKPRQLPIGFRIMRTPVIRELSRFITPRSIFEHSVAGSMYDQKRVTGALIDRYWELNRYPGNRAATIKRFALQQYSQPADAKALAGLKAPVLIMWGEQDNLIPVSSARWFAKAMPGSKLIVYPKVGHIPMEEVPDRSANDLKAWLGSALPPGSSPSAPKR